LYSRNTALHCNFEVRSLSFRAFRRTLELKISRPSIIHKHGYNVVVRNNRGKITQNQDHTRRFQLWNGLTVPSFASANNCFNSYCLCLSLSLSLSGLLLPVPEVDVHRFDELAKPLSMMFRRYCQYQNALSFGPAHVPDSTEIGMHAFIITAVLSLLHPVDQRGWICLETTLEAFH
jgi:hypothetical protein